MEEVMPLPPERIFNSPVETGMRALVILNALYPVAHDLNDLLLFDHLVVHTSDFSGPQSLHPDVPPRSGEPLVRRRLIEDGIALMRMRHLIEIEFATSGILYRASDDAGSLISLMRSDYAKQLVERADWLAERCQTVGIDVVKQLVTDRIGRWRTEFQHNPDSRSSP